MPTARTNGSIVSFLFSLIHGTSYRREILADDHASTKMDASGVDPHLIGDRGVIRRSLSNNWPKDFFGVEQSNAPITRIACPILAWFGTKEADVGTRADLELLQSAAKRWSTGPARVDVTMIQDGDHMYDGQEAQVARTIASLIDSVVVTRRGPASRP